MARSNNTPQASLANIPPQRVQAIVSDLLQLHNLGKCETDEEVETRIEQFFELCRSTSIRPGIESLSTALHIERTTLWKWSQGIGCSERRAEAIRSAKSMIGSFLEQATMQGQVNPVSGIFFAKNWLGYRDSYLFEQEVARPNKPLMTPEEIEAAIMKLEQDIPLDNDCEQE